MLIFKILYMSEWSILFQESSTYVSILPYETLLLRFALKSSFKLGRISMLKKFKGPCKSFWYWGLKLLPGIQASDESWSKAHSLYYCKRCRFDNSENEAVLGTDSLYYSKRCKFDNSENEAFWGTLYTIPKGANLIIPKMRLLGGTLFILLFQKVQIW